MFSILSRSIAHLRSRLNTALAQVEEPATRHADSGQPFWPFGFLRPEQRKPLTSARVGLLAVLQGLPVGLFFLLVDGAARRGSSPSRLVAFLVAVCLAAFVINRLGIAYFWNRRAERLTKHRERINTWRGGADADDNA
jgi:hypothetical protein